MNFFFFLLLFAINGSLSKLDENIVIISLSCHIKNINNTYRVINSILEQNVRQSLYKVLLILSYKEFESKKKIPQEILLLEKSDKISIFLIENELNLQIRLIYAMKKFPKNPILIISDDILFPEGWLDMFISNHKKYPNDILSASIQYYFGENLNITQFSEGYKGKKFGVFNHIANIIFNFGIINTNLGGTLYPPNSFKNPSFFDINLFLNISKDSDEFWQSCFIMIENKTLRQSSKIYDYTEYLIKNNILNEKIKIFEKYKENFIKHFPNFKQIVELRQKKIITSFTSYYKRINYIPYVVESIKAQTLFPTKIVLTLYKEDYDIYNYNLSGVEIIKVNENIKPHKKYFYTMLKYRDYAIITLDDDIYYAPDTIKSLYDSYIKHPNIISGRRTHLINYNENNIINKYSNWIYQQNQTKSPDYNIFITTGAGGLYPPDILNIEEEFMNLINEVLTTDDIFLKHLEIIKGIESVWVQNENLLGLNSPNISSKVTPDSLFFNNSLLNDDNINKINIDISDEIIRNICIQYKNIKTGLTIHLFNIYNIKNIRANLSFFNIDAYSYCPINSNFIFQIYFNKAIAFCFFNNSYSIIDFNFTKYNTSKLLQSICSINQSITNFDEYYFPVAKSNNISNINIYNKRKYVSIILKDFFCVNSHICTLIAFFFKNKKKGYEIDVKLSNINFFCKLNDEVIYLNNNIPIIANFSCRKIYFSNKALNEILIGGTSFTKIRRIKNNGILNIDDNEKKMAQNQFIINKVNINLRENYEEVIIKGQLLENLLNDMYELNIYTSYPKMKLKCFLKKSSKYIQSIIKCYTKNKINVKEILIENQIAYNKNYTENLLLLDRLTLYQNYEIINEEHFKKSFNNNHIINNIYFINSYYYIFMIFISLKFIKMIY